MNPYTGSPRFFFAAAVGDGAAAGQPDVQGIHLGSSPQDVLAKFKTMYPKGPGNLGTTLQYVKIDGSSDPQWLGRLMGFADLCNGGTQGCDNIQVQFSEPPNQQRVVEIQRQLAFVRGKEPTPDNVKAALLQKYGANPIVLGPNVLSWLFDEQGKPAVLAPAVARRRTQCAVDFLATKVDPNINGGSPSPRPTSIR